MSDKLRKLVREMLEQELEEISSTGSAGGEFMTPKAFKAGCDGTDEDEEPIVRKTLGEGRSMYHDVRDAKGTPARKIGVAISEVNRRLNEIDKVLGAHTKLKTENNIDYNGLWKRTSRHLGQLERKILSIARKLKELKS
jgi:hypothetical protein